MELPGAIQARWTTRQDGDLGWAGSGPLPASVWGLRQAILPRPWLTVRQVHGTEVAVVDDVPLDSGDAVHGPRSSPRPEPAWRPTADGLVSKGGAAALAVMSADCPTIVMASPEGVMAAIHAGWRGLVSGVLQVGVRAMRRQGATLVVAAIGPCIHPECYEFSPGDLDMVSSVLGANVRSQTASGRPGLDLPRAVGSALAQAGVEALAEHPQAAHCTSCTPGYFSFRARRQTERQALVVWRG